VCVAYYYCRNCHFVVIINKWTKPRQGLNKFTFPFRRYFSMKPLMLLFVVPKKGNGNQSAFKKIFQ
jgi:hypothetical protein